MGKEVDIEGVLFKSPENRERGSRLYIDVRSVFIEGKENRTFGKVIITTEERIKGLAYGERIRAIKARLKPFKSFQNPGSFDVKRYNERQGIYGTGFMPSAEWIISFGRDKSASFFINSLDKQRVKFGNFVRRNTPFPEGEILSAITIGDKGAIPSNLRNQFSEAGIAHLLAISGLHMGAVAVFFYFTFKWILKRSEYLLLRFRVPRLTAALTIIPILAYAAITGFATPVVRASIMAFLYFVSIVIGRDENKLNTLAVSAFIILLWHPWALFELSFQLSFASVLGILLMHRSYPFRLATIKDKFLTSIKTTCAASFATLPFIINSFGVFSVISVPANLIFVPLVEFLIVPIGLISFLLFLLSETLATPLLR
ncbi:MAG: ComEC/Rec2 family competence protein, partial [Thermodesulfobacteriota bacterium]